MKRVKDTGKEGGKDIFYILNQLKDRFDVFGYSEFLTMPKNDSTVIDQNPTGYRKLEEKIRNADSEAGIVLPLHLERAYEIMAEKGRLKKKDLQRHRERLILRYGKYLQDFASESDIEMILAVDETPSSGVKEVAQRAELYLKLFEFDEHTRGDNLVERGFYLDALRHIQAISAHIELDAPDSYCICSSFTKQDPPQEAMEKNVLISLIERWMDYCINDMNLSKKELARRENIYKNARRQIDNLFLEQS